MLDRLPDEILLKTLKKTRLETRRNSRPLFKRCDNLIRNFDLQKETVEYLKIFGHSGRYKISKVNSQKAWKFWIHGTYKELLDTLEKLINTIQNVSSLSLYNVEISDGILRELVKIRKISKLRIQNCGDSFSNILRGTQIDGLDIRPKIVKGNKPITERLVDEVLEQWMTAEKELNFSRCKTELTIRGIISLLKKMDTSCTKKRVWNFGIPAYGSLETVLIELREVEELFLHRTCCNSEIKIRSCWIKSKANPHFTAVIECMA